MLNNRRGDKKMKKSSFFALITSLILACTLFFNVSTSHATVLGLLLAEQIKYDKAKVAGDKAPTHEEEKKADSLPMVGKSNSSKDLIKNGTKKQRRYYDKNGKADMDIDYTDHGTPKIHPNPHRHNWNGNTRGPWYVPGVYKDNKPHDNV
jgi:hypothetical protein